MRREPPDPPVFSLLYGVMSDLASEYKLDGPIADVGQGDDRLLIFRGFCDARGTSKTSVTVRMNYESLSVVVLVGTSSGVEVRPTGEVVSFGAAHPIREEAKRRYAALPGFSVRTARAADWNPGSANQASIEGIRKDRME